MLFQELEHAVGILHGRIFLCGTVIVHLERPRSFVVLAAHIAFFGFCAGKAGEDAVIVSRQLEFGVYQLGGICVLLDIVFKE